MVIRGLHHTTPAKLIAEELEKENFQVKNIANVLSRNKEPLPLFFVDLAQNESSKDIYNLKFLLHSVIHVEEPRPKHIIPQCGRCQGLNHTKKYCNHVPRCLRCAGQHLTEQCMKSRQTPAKCVLCGKDHPANYKGCSVYRDLQRQRNPSFKYSVTKSSAVHSTSTQSHPSKPKPTPPSFNEQDFPPFRITQPYTSQSVTDSNNHSPVSSFSNIVQGHHHPVNSTELLNTMNTFITDLKNLLFPIITLLTQVTQTLCKQNDK